jgi:S1-C subfamily serine protease
VFGGDRSAVGRVAGVDVDADLAVIAVDTGGAPAIAWADDAQARVVSVLRSAPNADGADSSTETVVETSRTSHAEVVIVVVAATSTVALAMSPELPTA